MRRFDVLCVGLQCIDLLISSVDRDILNRESTPVDFVRMLTGGDALNQAVTAAALGARTALIGPVGGDSMGKTLLARIADAGIEAIPVRCDGSTSVSVVLIDENRDRHFMIPHNQFSRLNLAGMDLNAVRESRVVSVGSCMALPGLDGADMCRLLDMAKESGAVTAMDFKNNRGVKDMDGIWESVRHADWILPSEKEAGDLLGHRLEKPEDMAAALKERGAKNVVVKLGGSGCYLSGGGAEARIHAHKSEVVDTVGAGDTFAGAFLYALSKNWDAETCARFANAAGSIAVEQAGANGAVKSEAQVLERMRGRYLIDI